MKPSRKVICRWLVAAATIPTALWVTEAWRMSSATRDAIFDDWAAMPQQRVALVLGCVPRLSDGRPNPYFRLRIDAAARLFHAGRVEYLLVSGDSARDGQDEPTAMREGLLALDVPAERIVVDTRGLRTHDSVLRAKQVYGLTQMAIVSQRFHDERAIYIARSMGLSVVAYAARDPERIGFDKMRFREPFARLVAVLDAHLLKTEPDSDTERVVIGHAL